MNELSNALVVVDHSSMAKTLANVIDRDGCSPLELVDFFAIVEALVLNDRIVVAGNIHAVKISGLTSIVRELDSAGVLQHTRASTLLSLDSVKDEWAAQPDRFGSWTPLDEWYEAGRVLGTERHLGVPPVDLLRYRRFYMRYGLVHQQNSVCDLVGRYGELSKALQQTRAETRLVAAPLLQLPTPPLPALLLDRAGRREDFISEALELREEFATMRRSLTLLRDMLADDTISPRSKLREMGKWQRSWDSLNQWPDKYKSAGASVDLGLVSFDISPGDDFSPPSLNLVEVLQWAMKSASRLSNSWRIRPLHRLSRKYLDIPDGHIMGSMRRIFGDDPVAQFADLRMWANRHLGSSDLTAISQGANRTAPSSDGSRIPVIRH